MRLPAHGPLALVRQVDGAERTERVHLIGASERGLSFRAPNHITPSETVRITDDQADSSFKAVVRHCSPDNDGYTVGVEVVKESPQESSSADAAAAD